MAFDSKIFLQILQNLATENGKCYTGGYQYFDHVLELYKQKLFFAEVVYDEADRIAQLNNIILRKEGHQYLKELLTKKNIK
ncbi:MAG: hypothetical protein Q7S39_08630 [Ignavibacteria bacterium]|nr:hypothetical protein [Ignavibacteria bacterium]